MQLDSSEGPPSVKRSFSQQTRGHAQAALGAVKPASSTSHASEHSPPAKAPKFDRSGSPRSALHTSAASSSTSMPSSSSRPPKGSSRGSGRNSRGAATSSRSSRSGRSRSKNANALNQPPPTEGPAHDERYIEETYKKTEMKPSSLSNPKSALTNYMMVSLGKLPDYSHAEVLIEKRKYNRCVGSVALSLPYLTSNSDVRSTYPKNLQL
jgi:hypothetical protein